MKLIVIYIWEDLKCVDIWGFTVSEDESEADSMLITDALGEKRHLIIPLSLHLNDVCVCCVYQP